MFLSYRRADTSDVASRLNERLIRELDESRVFLDVVGMQPGVNFRMQLRDAIQRSAVMLVLIGPNWLAATDDEGRRRLDDPEDIVRTEIEEGLARQLRIIPVLVNGASMPRTEDLPADLAPLAELHPFPIAHLSYRQDDKALTDRVVANLGRPGVRRLGLYGGVIAAVAVLIGAAVLIYVNSSTPSSTPDPSSTAQPTPSSAPPPPSSTTTVPPTPTTAVEAGVASIQVAYDQPGGCSTLATVTADLNGDPRATGRVVWLVAVLDAPPNVLYYPKKQLSTPDGHFEEKIDLNTTSGTRRGHFSLIVSPTDQARDDLQQSLDADVTKNDAAYPDDRRTQLRVGNIEIAATPFVDQLC